MRWIMTNISKAIADAGTGWRAWQAGLGGGVNFAEARLSSLSESDIQHCFQGSIYSGQ